MNNKKKICKCQIFVILCTSFVGFHPLLAISLKITRRVLQCLGKVVCSVSKGGGRSMDGNKVSQANAASRLNVPLGSISIRRFRVQNTCSRSITSYKTCRRSFSSFFGSMEKTHCGIATRCRQHCSIGEKNLHYTMVRKCLDNAVCLQDDHLCVTPPTDDKEKAPL